MGTCSIICRAGPHDQKWGPRHFLAAGSCCAELLPARHHPLMPENVLSDVELNVKLADLGLSTEFIGHKLSTFCGSLPYASPELFLGENYDGPSVDVWSPGVVLYRMVTGTLSFMGEGFWELKQLILSRHYHVPYFLSFECEKLLKKLMALNPHHKGTKN